MIRLRWLSLCLLVVCVGCGADGGPVGTGLSGLSAIGGNVAVVELPSGTGAAGVAGVRVSIDELPGLEAVTDDGGNFDLTGDFSGAVTLRFRTGELVATERVDVPDAADVVLQDIVLARDGEVRFAAARVIGFLGRVAMADCSDGVLLVNDRRAAPNQSLVRITEDTVLLRGNGAPLACGDIVDGASVAVEGAVRFADRTIVAYTLTVDPPPPGSRPLVRQVRFRGSVAVVNCAGGMLLLDDPATGRTRLRLSAQTAIVGPTGRPIACSDLRPNDVAEGNGTINVRRPEVVEALLLTIRPQRPPIREPVTLSD